MFLLIILHYIFYLTIIFGLIPVDGYPIVRPLFTLFISIFFYLVVRVTNKYRVVSYIIFPLLTLIFFILLGEYGKITLYKSLIIAIVPILLNIIYIKFRLTRVYIIGFLILLLTSHWFLELKVDNFPLDSNQNIKSFTFESGTRIDTSNYQNKKTGLSALYHRLNWGDERKHPIKGIVYKPAKGSNLPLVIVTHGNALSDIESHLGYNYLLRDLANQGYFAVSLNHNFLNGDFTTLGKGEPWENDVRGHLILEAIKYIDKRFPEVNINNTSLIGHSRGGEASVIASTLTKEYQLPDITSIVLIAPTYKQYRNINYNLSIPLLTLGALSDGDLRDYPGINYHNGYNLTNNGSVSISLLYSKFNHAQFNTRWGLYDGKGPGAIFYTTRGMKKAYIQRSETVEVIGAFLNLVEPSSDFTIFLESLKSADYTHFKHPKEFKLKVNSLNTDLKKGYYKGNRFSKYSFKNTEISITNPGSEKIYIKAVSEIEMEYLIRFYPSEEEFTLLVSGVPTMNYLRSTWLQPSARQILHYNTYTIETPENWSYATLAPLKGEGAIFLDSITTLHRKTE